MSIRKSHTKNKDKFLDRGGANEVAVADVKSAVDLKHAQNTDIALDQGQVNEVTAADLRAHLDNLNAHDGTEVDLNTTGFSNNLSASDDTVQKALDTIDNIVIGGAVSWGSITGTLSNQTDLQTALDGKANTAHTHVEVDITDLDKYTKLEVDNLLALQDEASELATDTTNFNNNLSAADTTIQLALDTIDNLAIGSSPTWGGIIGTLSNQTDLQTALDGKASTVHTHVEANITDLDKYTKVEVNNLLALQDEFSELDDTNFTSLADADFVTFDLATGKWINEPFTSGVVNSIFEASAVSEGVSTTTSIIYSEKVKLNYTPETTGEYLIMWAAATSSDGANKPIELRVQQDDSAIINESTWGANFTNAFSNNAGFQIVTLTGGVGVFFDLDFRNTSTQGNPIGSVRRARISIFRIG